MDILGKDNEQYSNCNAMNCNGNSVDESIYEKIERVDSWETMTDYPDMPGKKVDFEVMTTIRMDAADKLDRNELLRKIQILEKDNANLNQE